LAAINHYLSETNKTLIERMSGNVSQYPDYVATVHEISHALGLAYEQPRSDRYSYVTINYSNIPSDNHDNFNKSGSINANYGSYDYDSIMHYGAYDCSMKVL
jgi:hypothetical protein